MYIATLTYISMACIQFMWSVRSIAGGLFVFSQLNVLTETSPAHCTSGFGLTSWSRSNCEDNNILVCMCCLRLQKQVDVQHGGPSILHHHWRQRDDPLLPVHLCESASHSHFTLPQAAMFWHHVPNRMWMYSQGNKSWSHFFPPANTFLMMLFGPWSLVPSTD